MNFGPLLLLAALSAGQTVPPAETNAPRLLERVGPASLWRTAAPDRQALVIAFTETLNVTVTVEGEDELEVQTPEAWTKSAWQVRAAGPPVAKRHAKGIRWTQDLVIEPLAPGEAPLQLEPLRYADKNSTWQTVSWKPLTVRVTSRLTEPDVKNARDITAIEDLPPLPPRQLTLGWIVGSLAGAAGLAALATLWLRRRQLDGVRPTPEAWALYEIQRLQNLRLPERGRAERFGTLLTGLVRRYLEKKHQLPARRQTTAEFLTSLPEYAALAPQRDFLASFLRRCDLLKFAPVSASNDECAALVGEVRQFITQQLAAPAASGA